MPSFPKWVARVCSLFLKTTSTIICEMLLLRLSTCQAPTDMTFLLQISSKSHDLFSGIKAPAFCRYLAQAFDHLAPFFKCLCLDILTSQNCPSQSRLDCPRFDNSSLENPITTTLPDGQPSTTVFSNTAEHCGLTSSGRRIILTPSQVIQSRFLLKPRPCDAVAVKESSCSGGSPRPPARTEIIPTSVKRYLASESNDRCMVGEPR